jgi:hypothetical protein
MPEVIGIKFASWHDGGQLLMPCMEDEDGAIAYLRCDIDPDDAVVVSAERSIDPDRFDLAQDRIAELEARKHELRAMLDEMILSVQGENVYLCDEVWATADRILAQLKEQADD